jgi:phosphoribosylglycinamide formyltransferase-1
VVDDQYDHGPVVAQARVPVEPGDTAETLATRVQAREQTLYVETLKRIFSGEIDLDRL